ncbi:MAG TPA: PEP-utilizing enzyme, partial [Dehalococcoidia bacterium]|nr:PEP-utilizing enzyme [Dehalococcoidia bacterium]
TLREQPAAEALRALPQLPGGPQVLARLHAFLDRFGDRLAGGDDWAEPTWREAPEQALQRAAALLETTSDGHVDHTQLIERRERITAEALCSIEDPDLRREFEESLRMMRRAWPLKEEHNFYIDQTLAAHMRYVMQEIGRRLEQRGAFDAPDDVFMLTLDEALDAFRAPQAPVLRSRVAERKAEREWQLSLDPPMLLGAPVEPEGAHGPPAAPRVLRGRPGSPGRARGPARVVLSIDDFPKLRAGDILVCRSTTPHWTPLFQSAAGIVAEAGGALSHAAIAAREYGIPAVLSVPAVTAILADGEPIEVDGAAGEVRRSID